MEPGFRLLGPLEAVVGTRPVALGGRRPRRLLAMLLLHAGRVVPADRLVEAVWEDDPPASATVTLRSHVASLRRSLAGSSAADVLVTRPPGYRLMITDDQVDARRFERLLEEGGVALDDGDAGHAAQVLRAALALWRGDVLADLDDPRFARAETARLEQLRLVAVERRNDADLALGRHTERIAALAALVHDHPLRERFRAQHMLALYRAGRQAEALAAFQAARHQLDEELGLAPGRELAALQAAILRQDPRLAHPQVLGAPRLADGEQRPSAGAARSTPASASALSTVPALFDVARRAPLVGRRGELDRLRGLWETVRTGGRGVALVAGEAGVGKTRLIAELASVASQEQAVVLVGHCEQATLVPYRPVTEALFGIPDLTAQLARLPAVVRQPLARLLAAPAATPSAERSPVGPHDEQQLAFLHAVVQLLARVREGTPVLLVVEDAERIDRASSRLLGYLADHLPDRILLVLCFRDPPGSRHLALLELLADLESRGQADRFELEPLPEAELATLVAAWSGTEAPPGFVHRLWSATGGNPFFATEIVRDLIGRGGIGGDEARWRLPSGVRDVLRQRLRALSSLAQEVIGCAGVLGREVDARLLAQVAEQPVDEVLGALEEAVDAGWLAESEHAAAPTYVFRHTLMLQAVHDDLPALRRQRLHLRAADVRAATGMGHPTTRAAAAVHLRAAGSLVEPERAARASLEAAQETAALYAWDDAIAHAEAAVTIRRQAGAPPEDQAAAAARAAEILIRSGSDLGRAVDHLRTAVDRYSAAGDASAVAVAQTHLGLARTLHHSVLDIPEARACFAAAEAVLTEGTAAVDLLRGKALADMYALELVDGCAASERAVELATRLERADLAAKVRPTQAVHEFSRGRVARAQTLVEEAWGTPQRPGDPHLAWEVVMAAALLGNVYLLDPVTAESWCRRGLGQRRFASVAVAHASVTDHLGYALASTGRMAEAREVADGLPADALTRRLLLRLDGDLEGAERSWSAALEHDLDNGDLMNAGLSAYWLGEVRWRRCADDDAVATLERALGIVDHGPQVPARLMVSAELARCLADLSHLDAAEVHLTSCEAVLAEGEDWRGRTGHVQLARAAVATARGEEEHADTAHAAALATFTRYRLPWWRAETLSAWARSLTAAGRTAAAEAKHAAARRLYDELVGEPDARRKWSVPGHQPRDRPRSTADRPEAARKWSVPGR